MALNQEKGFFSGINFGNGLLVEEVPDKCLDEFNNSCGSGNSHTLGEGKAEKVSDSDDIVDLLPRDPFGMDISATVTAITGWIDDFGLKNLGFESGEDEVENVDDQLLAELNIVWKNAARFCPDLINIKSDTTFHEASMELEGRLCDGPFLFDGDMEDFMGFSNEKYRIPSDTAGNHQGCAKNNFGCVSGPPPDALFFALGYLGARDLLSVQGVCRSLRDAVQNDPLLWRNIHIDYPLSNKITDDALLLLTMRAQGTLHSLSIAECLQITNNGLSRVLETNPRLTKLNVAGCIRLSIEDILRNLRLFKSVGRPGIKHLRIGGLFGITSQHFEELNLLLGARNEKQIRAQKLRFFRAGQLYLSFDNERDIDIETCPRCQQIRQVYDCPADSCRGKWHTPQACRACTFCISRCINCGCCLSNCDYEETFCLDLICLDCLKQILSSQERQKRVTMLPKKAYLHQQASYHFFLYG